MGKSLGLYPYKRNTIVEHLSRTVRCSTFAVNITKSFVTETVVWQLCLPVEKTSPGLAHIAKQQVRIKGRFIVSKNFEYRARFVGVI